jgi:hypothetical protein
MIEGFVFLSTFLLTDCIVKTVMCLIIRCRLFIESRKAHVVSGKQCARNEINDHDVERKKT